MSAEKNGPVLMDGAMGTTIWERVEDKKLVWAYNLENPDVVRGLHREYIAAGSEIILANTFGANALAVERASAYSVKEVVSAGIRIAREAAAGTGAKVALSAGPLPQLLEPYGDLTGEEAEKLYREQIGSGMEEGPDLILLETFMDVEMLRAAAAVAKGYGVPVFCTMTFEGAGRTIMGNSVQDMIDALTPMGIDAIGMNCSLGPDMALPIIREFAEKTDLPLIFKPNAGKPVLSADGRTESPYTAERFAGEVLPALDFAAYIGGCCGSDPAYIRALREKLRERGCRSGGGR